MEIRLQGVTGLGDDVLWVRDSKTKTIHWNFANATGSRNMYSTKMKYQRLQKSSHCIKWVNIRISCGKSVEK